MLQNLEVSIKRSSSAVLVTFSFLRKSAWFVIKFLNIFRILSDLKTVKMLCKANFLRCYLWEYLMAIKRANDGVETTTLCVAFAYSVK